jgi:hypothetical protein
MKNVRTLNIARLLHILSLFATTIPEHIREFAQFWHELKNFITAEMGILPSQPFISSHFHFFIVVECANLAELRHCAGKISFPLLFNVVMTSYLVSVV